MSSAQAGLQSRFYEYTAIKIRTLQFRKDIPFHIELMNSENWLKYIGDRNVHSEEDFLKFYRERFQKSPTKDTLILSLPRKKQEKR